MTKLSSPADSGGPLPLDALAGPDGTQDAPPAPLFADSVSGLLTGELLPTLRRDAAAAPPVLTPQTIDKDAVALTAQQLAAEQMARRTGRSGTQGKRKAAPQRPATQPRPSGPPTAVPPAGPGAIRSSPPGTRNSIGGWLIALLIAGILGFNLLRALIEALARAFH